MKKRIPVLTAAALVLLLVVPLQASLARAPHPSPATVSHPEAAPAANPLGIAGDDYAAYGTGTIVHADALTVGEEHLVATDVAFSGSAFSSAKPSAPYANEMGRLVAPILEANGGHGRGSGLELGVTAEPKPLIGDLAEASAPPSTELVEKKVGPVAVDPAIAAELLRGQAQARSAGSGCVLGSNLSYGLGSVTNLSVLNGFLSTVADPPTREVVQSTSATRIVPGSGPGRLGLQSEIRETIAPITFFQGMPSQFTVEVLGEWVLRTKADGIAGSAFYGPEKVSPETIVIRVLDKDHQSIGQLTFQQLLSQKGLVVKIPNVAEITVGEEPRAIDGDADSDPVLQPTMAMAAADVVRVKLANLGDVRVGHMETAVAVPSTGVICPGIKVEQQVAPPVVLPGNEFTYTIVVTNPNDCILDQIKIDDAISAPSTVKYEALSPISFSAIGPLGPGESKELKVKAKILPASLTGAMSAEAVAKGVCTAPDAGPDAGLGVPVEGRATVEGPSVGLCVVPVLTGLSQADAQSRLEAAGCKLGKVIVGDPSPGQTGKVIAQAPTAGEQVPAGTTVDITVGGPAQCSVADVIGLSEAEARAKLEAAGCKLAVVTGPTDDLSKIGKVIDQSPAAGTTAPLGATVQVTIGAAPGAGAGGTLRKTQAASPQTGTLVAGETDSSSSSSTGTGGSSLPRTGGIAFASLALVLTTTGLIARLAGRRRTGK